MQRVIRVQIVIPEYPQEAHADIEYYHHYHHAGTRVHYVRERVAFSDELIAGRQTGVPTDIPRGLQVALEAWQLERICDHQPGTECHRRQMPAGVFRQGLSTD